MQGISFFYKQWNYTHKIKNTEPTVKRGGGSVWLSLVQEALNVSKCWWNIWTLPRHVWAKCFTQGQETWFRCFNKTMTHSSHPDLNPFENSTIAKWTPGNLRPWMPRIRGEPLDGFKKHLEAIIVHHCEDCSHNNCVQGIFYVVNFFPAALAKASCQCLVYLKSAEPTGPRKNLKSAV